MRPSNQVFLSLVFVVTMSAPFLHSENLAKATKEVISTTRELKQESDIAEGIAKVELAAIVEQRGILERLRRGDPEARRLWEESIARTERILQGIKDGSIDPNTIPSPSKLGPFPQRKRRIPRKRIPKRRVAVEEKPPVLRAVQEEIPVMVKEPEIEEIEARFEIEEIEEPGEEEPGYAAAQAEYPQVAEREYEEPEVEEIEIEKPEEEEPEYAAAQAAETQVAEREYEEPEVEEVEIEEPEEEEEEEAIPVYSEKEYGGKPEQTWVRESNIAPGEWNQMKTAGVSPSQWNQMQSQGINYPMWRRMRQNNMDPRDYQAMQRAGMTPRQWRQMVTAGMTPDQWREMKSSGLSVKQWQAQQGGEVSVFKGEVGSRTVAQKLERMKEQRDVLRTINELTRLLEQVQVDLPEVDIPKDPAAAAAQIDIARDVAATYSGAPHAGVKLAPLDQFESLYDTYKKQQPKRLLVLYQPPPPPYQQPGAAPYGAQPPAYQQPASPYGVQPPAYQQPGAAPYGAQPYGAPYQAPAPSYLEEARRRELIETEHFDPIEELKTMILAFPVWILPEDYHYEETGKVIEKMKEGKIRKKFIKLEAIMLKRKKRKKFKDIIKRYQEGRFSIDRLTILRKLLDPDDPMTMRLGNMLWAVIDNKVLTEGKKAFDELTLYYIEKAAFQLKELDFQDDFEYATEGLNYKTNTLLLSLKKLTSKARLYPTVKLRDKAKTQNLELAMKRMRMLVGKMAKSTMEKYGITSVKIQVAKFMAALQIIKLNIVSRLYTKKAASAALAKKLLKKFKHLMSKVKKSDFIQGIAGESTYVADILAELNLFVKLEKDIDKQLKLIDDKKDLKAQLDLFENLVDSIFKKVPEKTPKQEAAEEDAEDKEEEAEAKSKG